MGSADVIGIGMISNWARERVIRASEGLAVTLCSGPGATWKEPERNRFVRGSIVGLRWGLGLGPATMGIEGPGIDRRWYFGSGMGRMGGDVHMETDRCLCIPSGINSTAIPH